MSPLLLLIPLGGGLIYLLTRPSARADQPYHAPAAAVTMGPVAPGGARATQYVTRVNQAVATYRMAKNAAALVGLGKEATAVQAALKEVSGTIDVVRGMAMNDLAAGTITQQDMDRINLAIDSAQTEIGK